MISVAAAAWHVKTTAKTYEVNGVMLTSDKKRNNFGGSSERVPEGVLLPQQ
ncbi:MAG: hypothetical protein IPP95_14990 [Flavobacteriales bacterium]|nr:MAG: hypothetical protein IPP95_14990 [Flavobacteriales bacterium]